MPIILNKEELRTSKLRKDALEILEAGLEAVQTERVLREKVKVKDGVLNIEGMNGIDLKNFDRIFFVGIGKCALDGAKVMEEILSRRLVGIPTEVSEGNYLTDGIVIDVKPAADAEALVSRGKIKYFEGTHPLPSEQNVEATKQILEMVKDLNANDLVITLISGGGSALFELPIEGVSLEDIINKTKELTARGADIYELNAVRKEMSQVKGGKFAEFVKPAQMISLLFSDVLGNDISVIASGPTVGGEAKNILVASNADALQAMEEKAEELGYDATIETDRFSGDAIELGKNLALREEKPNFCLLMGGETTVKITNENGIGGRNQTMALAALSNIKQDMVLVCAASDGFDNSDHCGAIVDRELFEKSKNLNLNIEEFLQKNDSYNFFKQSGGAISTGRLGSNVSDLCILIYK